MGAFGMKLTLELLLSLDNGDKVDTAAGVVVDSGGQVLDVTVDGDKVGLGGGSVTSLEFGIAGDEGSSGRDGEEDDVGDGNHVCGLVVCWEEKKIELIVVDDCVVG
jgi:hypothetical protein